MTINQLITANLLKMKCSLLLLAPTGKRLGTLFVTLGLKNKKEIKRKERVKYTINSTHTHCQIQRINVIYLIIKWYYLFL